MASVSLDDRIPKSIIDRYDIHHLIGGGSYSVAVYRASDRAKPIKTQSESSSSANSSSGISPSKSAQKSYLQVALKQMRVSSEKNGVPLDVYRELKTLKEVSHPNLVCLFDLHLPPPASASSKRDMFLAYELADFDLTDLVKCLSKRGPNYRLDSKVIQIIMGQLLAGLGCLHENWIMHRDIKSANIFIWNDGRVKLGDFGLSRIFRAPLRKLDDDGDVVTLWYRAPELILGSEHYTRSIDVWSLGLIFAELYLLEPMCKGHAVPYSSGQKFVFQSDQMKRILEVLGKPSASVIEAFKEHRHFSELQVLLQSSSFDEASSLSAKLKLDDSSQDDMMALDLISRMLDYDPLRRITEALAHPFFSKVKDVKSCDISSLGIVRRLVDPSHFRDSLLEQEALAQLKRKKRMQDRVTTATASAVATDLQSAEIPESPAASVQESQSANANEKIDPRPSQKPKPNPFAINR